MKNAENTMKHAETPMTNAENPMENAPAASGEPRIHIASDPTGNIAVARRHNLGKDRDGFGQHTRLDRLHADRRGAALRRCDRGTHRKHHEKGASQKPHGVLPYPYRS